MFHVPNMFRTLCSEHVPNIQDCHFHPKKTLWDALKTSNMRNAKSSKLFTLLVVEKSNSQSLLIYNVHAFKNPGTYNP